MTERTREAYFDALKPFAPGGHIGTDDFRMLDTVARKWGLPERAPAVAAIVPHDSSYDRAAMKEELVRDEGERLRAYKDTVGKWTIGIGRNLDDVGISAAETQALGITTGSALANGITQAQSRGLLDSDLDRVDADLDRRLPWWRKLDPVRQRVLVNMCFNMGIDGLCGFKNTLGMVDRRDYAGAAANMLHSKWADQVGARAKRLSEMMRTGA